MKNPLKVAGLIKQAYTEDVPPLGDLTDADELIGFPFALIRDGKGEITHPGFTNIALVDFILGNEILRSLHMTVTEELAMIIHSSERIISDQIDLIKPTTPDPNKYDSYLYMQDAKPRITERGARNLAVIAFRHHLPRAAAVVAKAGFQTTIPDLRDVGEFEPSSTQRWTRSRSKWITREALAIPYFAAADRI